MLASLTRFLLVMAFKQLALRLTLYFSQKVAVGGGRAKRGAGEEAGSWRVASTSWPSAWACRQGENPWSGDLF